MVRVLQRRNCRARATPTRQDIYPRVIRPCHAGAVTAKSGMTEVSTQDRAKRRSSAAHAAVLVSGYELARHFGCSRQNVDLLAQQGVIERRSDGKFDQDVSRLKYLTHLRGEHRRSPRAAADAELASAKAALLRTKWNGPRFFGLRDKEDRSAMEARP